MERANLSSKPFEDINSKVPNEKKDERKNVIGNENFVDDEKKMDKDSDFTLSDSEIYGSSDLSTDEDELISTADDDNELKSEINDGEELQRDGSELNILLSCEEECEVDEDEVAYKKAALKKNAIMDTFDISDDFSADDGLPKMVNHDLHDGNHEVMMKANESCFTSKLPDNANDPNNYNALIMASNDAVQSLKAIENEINEPCEILTRDVSSENATETALEHFGDGSECDKVSNIDCAASANIKEEMHGLDSYSPFPIFDIGDWHHRPQIKDTRSPYADVHALCLIHEFEEYSEISETLRPGMGENSSKRGRLPSANRTMDQCKKFMKNIYSVPSIQFSTNAPSKFPMKPPVRMLAKPSMKLQATSPMMLTKREVGMPKNALVRPQMKMLTNSVTKMPMKPPMKIPTYTPTKMPIIPSTNKPIKMPIKPSTKTVIKPPKKVPWKSSKVSNVSLSKKCLLPNSSSKIKLGRNTRTKQCFGNSVQRIGTNINNASATRAESTESTGISKVKDDVESRKGKQVALVEYTLQLDNKTNTSVKKVESNASFKYVRRKSVDMLITNKFLKQFRTFSKHGDISKSGFILTSNRSALWLRIAGLLESATQTESTTKDFRTFAGGRISMNIYEYVEYLTKIFLGKMPIEKVIECLSSCPPPPEKADSKRDVEKSSWTVKPERPEASQEEETPSKVDD